MGLFFRKKIGPVNLSISSKGPRVSSGCGGCLVVVFISAFFGLSAASIAISGEPAKPDHKDDVKVSLQAPYPEAYKGAPTDKISLQYAVKELCRQAGKEYDFSQSLKLSGAAARKWIRPTIKDQPFRDAVVGLLIPETMGFETVAGKVVISPIVIVTDTGKHYHRSGCASAKDGTPKTLRVALENGLGPCAQCKPPAPDEKAE